METTILVLLLVIIAIEIVRMALSAMTLAEHKRASREMQAVAELIESLDNEPEKTSVKKSVVKLKKPSTKKTKA